LSWLNLLQLEDGLLAMSLHGWAHESTEDHHCNICSTYNRKRIR